jgi:hypothetical protein
VGKIPRRWGRVVDLAFQPEWWDLVRRGVKRQTVRPYRGPRSLKRAGQRIRCIKNRFKPRDSDNVLHEDVIKEVKLLTWHEIINSPEIVEADGFPSRNAMVNWFVREYGALPLDQSVWQVIRW